MLDTVWRLGEKDFDVDDFLRSFCLNDLAVVFHKGERRSHSNVHERSGFNILVSENRDSLENISELNQFLVRHKDAFDYLVKLNIHSVLDIGCSVDTADQFTKSVNIPCKLLGILNKLNVSLEFSIYPASDEETET